MQQCVRGIATPLRSGNPDADRNVQLSRFAADGEGRALDALAQAFSDRVGELDIGIRHHDNELLAAIPASEIDPPDIGRNAGSKRAQHFIAYVMAEIVIDRFEEIDVQNEKRDRPS